MEYRILLLDHTDLGLGFGKIEKNVFTECQITSTNA